MIFHSIDTKLRNPDVASNLNGLQCSNRSVTSPWDNCNAAMCDSNNCVSGTTLLPTCPEGDMKEESELCGLRQNNCKDGLKCVDQEDGCDNDVGICVKSGK